MVGKLTNGDHAESPMKCEIKVWHHQYDKSGEQEKVAVDNGLDYDQPNQEEYAAVLERSFDEKKHLTSTELTVNSPILLQVFRDIVRRHPSVAADFSEPFTMKSPFQMLYHHWDDLDNHRKDLDESSADTRKHLDLLFEFMEAEIGSTRRRIERSVRSGRCEYEDLWTIFKPGATAVSFVKSHPWLYTISKTAYEEDNCNGKRLEVHCVYTDHDGTNLGQSKQVIKILQKVDFGQGDPAIISELPVAPLACIDASKIDKAYLRERGEKFVSLSKQNTVQVYEGLAEYVKNPSPSWFHPDEDDSFIVWRSFTEKGRVVLDAGTYREEHYLKEVTSTSSGASLDLTLCPPYVYGYSCGRKDWCRFFLPHIKEPKWKVNPFDSLALPDNQKSLVRALVSSHHFPDNPRDAMEQKGKGLVCLLHGPPGSGKTLTAECAAELTHKALFSCSMSELNQFNDAYYFEKKLKEVLHLATVWSSVVLLDEADVFLEARKDDGQSAAERNALVAVFLKHLEYFSGIVFLTTNRIQVFDAAMKSRVHLALGYSPPNQNSRRLIWSHNFESLPEGHVDGAIKDSLDSLAVEDLNGREISNAVTTACTLARFSSEPLQLRHVEAVLNMRKEFEVALTEVRT